jgi:hypothetical protein
MSGLSKPKTEPAGYQSKGIKHGPWLEVSIPTIAECLENARQCEWYAGRTNDEEDRKFLLRKARDWTKLAQEKELEIRASARAAA